MKTYSKRTAVVCGNYLHTVNPATGDPSFKIAYNSHDGPQPEWGGNLERLAASWNACLGLELPAGLPPGILTKAVNAARVLTAFPDPEARAAAEKDLIDVVFKFDAAESAGQVIVLSREEQLENLRTFVEEWGGIETLRADLAAEYPG